ncbi:hypothetical protein H5410_028260 [Solanum commersonii]|uniref:Secreted protein n=1 Tax=Solanum commersonii TaxID=4109 RepID=A0A9J5Z4A6_SOLCO|nr:hypothetical protein H5410_028260 [Solanum commersonii]
MSGVRLVWLGWILASSSDIITRMPSPSRIKSNLGLLDVNLLCCIPDAPRAMARILDSVDAVGMGPSLAPICPKQMLLANDNHTRLGPDRA